MLLRQQYMYGIHVVWPHDIIISEPEATAMRNVFRIQLWRANTELRVFFRESKYDRL